MKIKGKIIWGAPDKGGIAGSLFFSLLLHLLLFCLILVMAPGKASTRAYDMTVYQVRLVELPGGSLYGGKKKAKRREPLKKKKGTRAKKSVPLKGSKRVISPPKPKKRVVTIAKKTVSRKKKKTEETSSKLLEEAISKIKSQVKEMEADRVIEERIAKLSSGASTGGTKGIGTGRGYGPVVPGVALQLYQAEVEEKIKSNWSYPTALESKKDLEAVLIVVVKNTGEIINIEFKKRSGNRIFDLSVLKAIKRSEPLPPFPPGYTRRSDEIEVKFNLNDLQARR